MNLETFIGIRNLSSLSILLPIFTFAIAVYKKKQPKAVWLLGLLLFVSGLADFLSYLFHTYFGINPNPVISVYALLQFIILCFVYRSEYTSRVYKTLVDIGSILFSVFAITNFLFIQGIKGINSNTLTVSSIALMVICLLYFYQIIRELPEPYIERLFMFWVSAAVFFYFGTNLFLFLTVDRMIIKADEGYLLSWGLHNGTNTIKNIIFAIAFHVTSKTFQ